jgi:SurA N-terminal domain/PPIC-type PPIASE domain
MNKIITQSKNFVTSKIPKKYKPSKSAEPDTQRITNETVAEVREDVLKSARKVIYPLAHSKHRVLITSTGLILVAVLGFLGYMVVALYKQKSTSKLTYKLTQVVPFPIAKVGGSFVAYENYLFELERYIFYFNNIEKSDFNTAKYKPQLVDQQRKILDRVVNQAYVRRVASDKGITVSDKEVDDKLTSLKAQNRLGNNNKVFEDTLRDFYDWDVSDFRRSIRNDILMSKVVSVLDVEARTNANAALDELKNGADFGATAAKYSSDTITKDKAGVIDGVINLKDRNLTSEQVDALTKLKPGEVSDVLNLGYGLEIIKKLEDKDSGVTAAHILVVFKPMDQALADTKSKIKATTYIKL